MALQSELAAATNETAGSDGSDGASSDPGDRPGRTGVSPFSMDYDLDSYDIDSDDMNNALTALVAVTNLL